MTSQFGWIALLIFSTLAAEGAGLRQLWEIDLTTSISEKPGAKLRQPTVFAIRFSPNNQHLAVITEEFIASGSQAVNTHLLILQAKQGRAELQFEVERGIADSDNMTSWPSINWTASGDAVIAGAEAIRVSDQRACGRSWGDATVGSRLVLGANFFAAAESIARFLLSDFACEPVPRWKFKRDWRIEDISLEKGLLCVTAPLSIPSTDPVTAEYARIRGDDQEVMVVDPLADKVIQRWPAGAVPLGDLRFRGRWQRTLCGRQSGEKREPAVRLLGGRLGKAPGGNQDRAERIANRRLVSLNAHSRVRLPLSARRIRPRRDP